MRIGLELADIVLHAANWFVVGGIDNTEMHFQRSALGLSHAVIVVLRGICVLGALSGLKKSGCRLRFRWVVVIACGLLVGFLIAVLVMPMVALMGAVSGSKSR